MRAFVITAPGAGEVRDVAEPSPAAGEVVVEVERAGVCGTDTEFWTGAMAYLESGDAAYPIRIGHEWCGRVSAVGAGVSPDWLGRRVTGDTMLGCGRCARCTGGRQHLCADRQEIGIRGGRPGALATHLPVPVSALLPLPDALDPALGALVEPGGNALRAVRAAGGRRVLIIGPGTIGLLAAMLAEADGAEVHLLGLSTAFPRSIGFARCWTEADLPDLPWDAVIEASGAASAPARAVELVEPGGRVVFIGIAAGPSPVDSRALALKDATAVGVLSASGGLTGTIERYASGTVDPRPLIAATVGLSGAAKALSTPRGDGPPKVHVDPRLP